MTAFLTMSASSTPANDKRKSMESLESSLTKQIYSYALSREVLQQPELYEFTRLVKERNSLRQQLSDPAFISLQRDEIDESYALVKDKGYFGMGLGMLGGGLMLYFGRKSMKANEQDYFAGVQMGCAKRRRA
ncbi:hypothetical protein JW711_05225 [Candidatus Woesearchaeota archaeon]|nr:hypothetical protein [Candidatus Woesearchaeota archaeon]